MTRAYSDLAHRGHLETGRPYPVGAPDVMRLTSELFASRVPAGDRLILTVSGGDDLLLPGAQTPLLTVHTARDMAGDFTLRVVKGELRFTDDGG